MINLYSIDHFSLEQTFDCGQCFRFEKDENGVFYGVVANNAVKAYYHTPETICLESSNPDPDFWNNYLNFSCNYADVEKQLSNDKKLLPCIKAGQGIRILRQDLWETIVSFIISANNNIPRIKKIINKLCELYGEKIEFDSKVFFGFPSAETLAKLELSDLSEIRAGFRDKYILDAAKKVVSKEVDLERLPNLENTAAKAELMKIKGVGTKVADCILLFSLGRHNVFPLDVWTKRILTELYGVEEKAMPDFVEKTYGNNAGIAQQYLYYYYAIEKNK
ncbi:MAG: DNA-3-methyladenine glycosylase 2 family protein [Clostridia bacterium]|nr:DNA-3-methyladenine glycosylase 2 family protein [Clostridia bacterium]